MYRYFLLFLLLFLIQTGLVNSATVNSTNDPGDGVCDVAECTLREALATGDATIDFNLTLPATINLSGGDPPLAIDSDQTIMGPGADMLTVSGINVHPVFEVDAAVTDANINGLNIIDGQSAIDGACIINDGVLTISDSTISGCDTMMSGGGIDNNDTLTLNNCLITDNTAQINGAGIDSAGTLVVNKSTISGNDAEGATSVGGGISAFNSSQINESTISGNTAVDAGGGLLNSGLSTMTITNSTISGNSQTDAGGTGGGGLAQGTFGTANIINSTITANSASAAGGGVNVGNDGTVNIGGSIVANQNAGGDCVSNGTLVSNGDNIESGTSCEFMEAGDLQDIDPRIGPLADNGGPTQTHALLPGSFAIDNAGTCGLMFDQRGEPREADDCDTGSFEAQKASLTITKVTNPPSLLGFDFASNIPDEVCTPILASGEFTLDDGESISCTITEGEYDIAEILPVNNTLTISCDTEPADGVSINNTLGTLDFTTLPEDTEVDCTFNNVDDSVFALDVVLAGPGTGTVTGPVGVPNNGGIDCPGDCSESYNPGTNVTLSETAAAGSEFQGWSGDCNASGQVVINGNRTCVATFKIAGGGDVLNPGEPLEFIQDDIPEVKEDGDGTLIITARNATDANLTNVEISIVDEIIVSKEITNVRLEPSTAFLEPNIGSCLILENSVDCDIATLVDDVDIVIDFVAEDVPPGDVDIFLTGDADQIGGLVNATALVVVKSGGDGGCTVAPKGSDNNFSMLLFLLIPAAVLTRKLFKMKR